MLLKLVLLVISPVYSDCANILAVLPCPSYSHQIAYRHLWKELSLRGHKVTLITPNPLHDPNLVNLTEIDMTSTYRFVRNISRAVEDGMLTMWSSHAGMLEMMKAASEAQLSHPAVQDLIHDPKSFDVVFVEFLVPEWLAFAEIYKCPKVLFSSMEVTASLYHLTGNPAHPILHPEFVSPFHGQLTFKERVMSTLVSWYYKYYFAFTVFPERQKILNKYFDTNSTITGLISDIDLMILSISPLIQGPRALGPNTISIAGYREDLSSQPLSPDVKKFLDDAKEGCIYVSFGSNVKSSQLSQRLLKAFIEALADVPYKVLWKFETATVGMPKNIKTAKWLPQQKVLNHPNVKLFLSQGGLQSMEEAIYAEVPFVIIPFLSDQFQNSKILKDKGVAVVLNRQTLRKVELKNALMEVMNEPKYRDGVKKIKQLILDEPMTGLEKAVWWTEYVIRNKGAKHLRNPTADLPFYQYFLLDVLGFLFLIVILIVTALVLAVKKISNLLWKLCSEKAKTQ
ncbi:UDP-glucuronosyltransferase 2B7-like [Anoplophora glabripennis]|uniref:UDP-glucuronosyltransferase 2B7-like n=1 Tax=Anoplophora glabripennis TaxID=217634 RepID=UPI0008753ADA|nr:UDP-glucuronosyltransferase 2B7-like [Anoplophora glabripennis]